MPSLQEHQSILLPQAYLTNFHNRIRNEPTISLLDTSLAKTQVRGHKRAKVVNYAEFDNDLFDDLIGEENSDNEYSSYNQTSNTGGSANNYYNNNGANGNNNNNFINSALFDRSISNNNNNNEYEDNINYPILSGTNFDPFNTTTTTTTTTNNYIDKEDDNTTSNTNFSKKIDLKDRLPDLDEQDDIFNVLKYPKIRETFQQSKLVTPYRLDLFKNISMNPPISSTVFSLLNTSTLAPATGPASTATTTTTTDNTIETDNDSKSEPIIIPVALNIENNGVKIIDHFTWNINDPSMTPEEFANIYCQDLDLQNNAALNQQIVNAISDSIKEYETVASIKFNQDFQILVNLTCHLQDYFLEDNFQWNLNDPSLTPELFSEILVTDLGLKREFLPIITYSLYDTILKVKKEYLEGNSSNTSTTATNLNNEAAFGYLAGVRLNLDDLGENWAPRIELLTPEEIQRKEIEKERKLRRLKRENDRLSRRGRRRLDELELTMKL